MACDAPKFLRRSETAENGKAMTVSDVELLKNGIKPVPEAASFFKVVNPSMEGASIGTVCMSLPWAYTDRFKDYLKDTLELEAPNGERWQARLERDAKSKFRMTKGWKEFATDLGIESGDLLVFKLVSEGHFQVQLFEGEDCCEKELAYKACSKLSKKRKQGCKFRDADSRKKPTIEESNKSSKSNGYSGKKGMNIVDKGIVCSSIKKSPRLNSSSVGQPPNGDQSVECSNKENKNNDYKEFSQLQKETQKVLKEVSTFSSSNPFTTTVMLYSAVCHGFKLRLKADFSNKYMSEDMVEVTLTDDANKKWQVNWLGNSKGYTFSGGWKRFASDHDLKVGDICILELIQPMAKSQTFKVHIFRVADVDREAIKHIISLEEASL